MPDPYRRQNHTAFSFPAVPASISEIRRLVVSEARALPFTENEIDDISLAVSEVFTNLVQYAPGYRIRGVCITQPQQFEIRFEMDESVSAYMERRTLPAGLSYSGRGIPLVHLVIPTVEMQERGDGLWELRLVKPISRQKELSP